MKMDILLPVIALTVLIVPVSMAQNIVVVPAVQDVTVDIDNMVTLNTDTLSCDGGATDHEFSMVQFDISDVHIGDNDVCVLLLKAASVEKRNSSDRTSISAGAVESGWTEESSYWVTAVAFASAVYNLGNSVLLATDYDAESIFAFDVSTRVKEAAAVDDLVSFSLTATNVTDYRVNFKSRETGEGPCLLVMPYPLPAVEGGSS